MMILKESFYRVSFLVYFSLTFLGHSLLKDTVFVYSGFFLSLIFILVFLVFSKGVKVSFISVVVFFAILAPIVFSSIFGVSQQESMERLVLYALPVLFLLVSVNNMDVSLGIRQLAIVLSFFYAFIVVLSLIAFFYGDLQRVGDRLYNYFNIFGFRFSQVVMGSVEMPRLGGSLGNPNQLGFIGFCVFSVVALSGLGFSKLKHYGLLIFPVVGVLVSQSRLSFGALALMILAFIFVQSRNAKIGVVIFLVIGVLSLVFYGLYDYSMHSMSSRLGSTRLSLELNSRDEIWVEVYSRILERPFLGFGLASSPMVLAEAQNVSAHNFYLQFILEVGLFGSIFFFLLLIFLVFYFGWHAFVRRFYPLVGLCFSFQVLFLFSMFFEVFLFSNMLVTSIWALLTFYSLKQCHGLQRHARAQKSFGKASSFNPLS